MGLNIGGQTVTASDTGVAFNTNCIFNSNGLTTINGLPGYESENNSATYYSLVTGTPSVAKWTSGQLNGSTGVFTAVVAGFYFAAYQGIHNGGSGVPPGYNAYGYGGWAKNGALSYFIHWNVTASPWNQGGAFAIFNLAVGDTLALFINRSPAPVADGQAANAGLYPIAHGSFYVILIG